MAADTREKRFSIMQLGETSLTMFEADGTVDADDKYHLLGMYSGITKAGVAEPSLDLLPTMGMWQGIPP